VSGFVNLVLTFANFHLPLMRLLRDFTATDYFHESETNHAAVQTIPGKERALFRREHHHQKAVEPSHAR
jgi:hypothetical protein